MTRIFTDGAEMGDTLFWDNTYNLTASNVDARSGNYSYLINGSTLVNLKSIADTSEFYFRFGVNTTVGGFQTSGAMIVFRHDATVLLRLSQAALYRISADVGTSSVAVGTNPLTATWHLIEMYVKIDDAPNGRFVVYMDGLLEIDFTGNTKVGADTHINNFSISRASTGINLYFDDLAMNDTDNSDGKGDNSWCGDGHVFIITPSGSGTTNNWLNSGSVSGSANYLYVDEYPNDGDTTYVYASGSNTGYQDQYALSSFSGTGKLVTRIYSEARIRKTTTDNAAIKLGYLPDGGTDQLSGSLALFTSYTRVVGTSASTNPVTGEAWTEADLNALEFVCEVN
jgi:hypothetical protein